MKPWVLTLEDKASGPARKAGLSLSQLEARLKAVRAEEERQQRLAKLAPAVTGQQTKQIQKQTTALKQLSAAEVKSAAIRKKHAAAGWTWDPNRHKAQQAANAKASQRASAGKSAQLGASRDTSDMLAGGALGAAIGLIGAGIGAFSLMTKLSFGLAQMIGQAQEFRASTTIAFENILHSKEEAAATYKLAQKTALETGADYRESISSMNSLMAQGFDTKFADNLVRSMADLKTINPAARLEGITRAISQIKSTGKLQGDEMMQLAEAGLNVGDVYKQIAKDMGIVDGKKGKKGPMSAVEQVQALQKDGKISSDVAIKAIMATIKAQTGGKEAGTIASEKANKTLTGAMMRAASMKEMFLESVNLDWSPLTRVMDRVQKAMGGQAGKYLTNALESGFEKILGIFDEMSDQDIEDTIINVADGFETFADAAVDVADAIMTVVRAANWLNGALKSASDGAYSFADLMVTGFWAVVDFIFPVVAGVRAIWNTVKQLGSDGGAAWDGFVAKMGAGAAAVGGFVAGLPGMIYSGVMAVPELLSGLGGQMIDGLIGGIEAGAAGVVDALVGAVESAIDAAEAALEIASPSKRMFRTGKFTTKGAELGIKAGAPGVAAAAWQMGDNAARAGSAWGGQLSNVDNSKRTSVSMTQNNYGGDPETQSRAFANSAKTMALTAG